MTELFAVYVHWPFCKAKCPYCDFNSHVSESIDHDAWARAYEKEIAYTAKLTGKRTVTSIFFGGGTPSLMEPETVSAVITAIQKNWQLANNAEITLEANPTSIEAGKFEAFRAAGVNRVSIGVQALNNKDLKFLGREHSTDEAMKAVTLANEIFDRVSFDLIYARPEQTIEDWRKELKEALKYATSHLSLYQLTIEQGTPFYTWHNRGDFKIPEPDQAGEFYEVTQDVLSAAGFPSYEISNHAKAGEESVHNLTYWKYYDYAGIGPGAHGRLTLDGKKQATRTHRAPEVWLEKVEAHQHGYHEFDIVDADEIGVEFVMMGLRLKEGIDLDRLSQETGKPWQEILPPSKIQKMEEEGYLIKDSDQLMATQEGRQRLNSLLSYLLA